MTDFVINVKGVYKIFRQFISAKIGVLQLFGEI